MDKREMTKQNLEEQVRQELTEMLEDFLRTFFLDSYRVDYIPMCRDIYCKPHTCTQYNHPKYKIAAQIIEDLPVNKISQFLQDTPQTKEN